MKLKFLLFSSTLLLFALAAVGQTKATLYKADQWLDIKGKGSWAKAYSNPTKEKVEVTLSIKSIKVTLGSKTLDYKLNSFYRFSDAQWRYVVSRNGGTFEISISEHKPGTYSISIEGDEEWMITPITDVSVTEIK